MYLKGNNAQTYPYSVFILKREFQINVRQGGKFLPNAKWQKKAFLFKLFAKRWK